MRKYSNDCGFKNSFGFYDARSREIVLKRPCFNKKDIAEIYAWMDQNTSLLKFSMGIGAVESIVAEDSENLYASARDIIRQSVQETMLIDNDILLNLFDRLLHMKALYSVSLKCFIFDEDATLFDDLMYLLKNTKFLSHLDLSGSYFTDEQLLQLAEFVTSSNIAHLAWPAPRMSENLVDKIYPMFKDNRSLVVVRGMPSNFKKISLDNRQRLFDLLRRPATIGDNEIKVIRNYAESIRLALVYEKQRLYDMESLLETLLS